MRAGKFVLNGHSAEWVGVENGRSVTGMALSLAAGRRQKADHRSGRTYYTKSKLV
jgi:hypothetical protein